MHSQYNSRQKNMHQKCSDILVNVLSILFIGIKSKKGQDNFERENDSEASLNMRLAARKS